MGVFSNIVATHKLSHKQREEYFYRIFDRALAVRYAREIVARGGRSLLEKQMVPPSQSSQLLRPRMDVFDDPTSPLISVVLELPGIKKEHVSIDLRGTRLEVSGERRCPLPPLAPTTSENADDMSTTPSRDDSSNNMEPDPRHPLQELKYGRFWRVITLPQGVEVSEIRSAMEDGMLTITFPRPKKPSPPPEDPVRHIEIA